MSQPSVRIVKNFTFKGGEKEWSNRYYFDGSTLADSDAWHNFFDALVNLEKTMFNGQVGIVRAIGYDGTSDVPAASKTYTTLGTLSSSGVPTPGECAIVARMSTTKTGANGHPVYVFSYYHHILKASSDLTGDVPDSTMRTAVGVYIQGWKDGITVGGRTFKRTTPDGHATTGHSIDTYISHRDFPR
jgi:hypothetical protein